ncbi:MAG: hypothetical protein DRP35_09970 [Candidatus Zixiibacteriota bacterium]|nr:MAG: hypothetical protein DRP35_09970 [candidate division Zixibacteria bacterium]
MIYRENITPEMQEKWFSGIEKSYHHSYYIIHFEGKDIGLFNQKNFRVPGEITESGIFLVDEKLKTSYIPVIASLTLIEGAFFAMGETESFVRVLKTNQEALNYNLNLGYEIYEGKNDFFILRMTPESFLRKTKKLRKAIRNLYGNSLFELFLEPIDFQLGYAPFFRDLIYKIPEKLIEYKKETDKSLEVRINIDIE